MGNKWYESVTTQNDIKLYRKRIEEFSQYNEDEKKKFYNRSGFGIIVQKYPIEFETLIYEKIAKLIVQRYPDFVDEVDIVNTLMSAGSIYTMKVSSLQGHGFYHLNSADIGIYAYLDRISDELLHEVIHKLGYLKFNPEFYDMDVMFREAGTEIVTNKVLGKKECKECIVRGAWVKSLGPDQEYLLQTALVNQINQAMGGESLEQSVLQGKNIFQAKMESVFGEEFSVELSKRVKELTAYEKEYWNNYTKRGNDSDRENKLMKLFQRFQNDLMHKAFDEEINNADSVFAAKYVLNKLVEFSDFRIKRKVVEGDETFFRDDEFKKYFEKAKRKLEKRFDTKIDVDYDEDEWSVRHPVEYIPDAETARKVKERKSISEKARIRTAKISRIPILSRRRQQVLISEGDSTFVPNKDWIEKVELSFKEIVSNDGKIDKYINKKKNTEIDVK